MSMPWRAFSNSWPAFVRLSARVPTPCAAAFHAAMLDATPRVTPRDVRRAPAASGVGVRQRQHRPAGYLLLDLGPFRFERHSTHPSPVTCDP
ncbi:exported hypothetical protein [Actinacidiphila cocklensis]|uniref:Uncharacterized protein n=1 Tax=Actinacidiphila cocklensis TaxID=887465 RepID=A0A9W4GNY3_9ACTN|nr:exported hypothetical protein [Actinacidiphila cocklensis]